MNEAHNFRDPAQQPENREHQGELSQQGQSVAAMQNWLKVKLAEYLEIEPDGIDPTEPFSNYGLSSVDAVGLSGDLEDWLGRTLSPTVVYDYPSIARLARYLAGDASVAAPLAADPTADQGTTTVSVAIIGMACRFPGGVTTPEAFWQLLKSGIDTVTEIPAERWDVDAFYDAAPSAPGKMYTRYGCFLRDIDQFDAHFFGISPRETLRMDPQQRLLVEVAWEALENAGLAASELAGSQTGVFVGMMNNHEYAQLQIQQGDESSADDPFFAMGSASSIAAGRLPYLFDFQGPALALDTACSSSLVAAHLACQSLHNKECDLALVGGVNAIMLPENMVNACKMGMLAVDGHCKTFDAAADGFVLGEGCGVVVLKRLADAVADGDPILAVIRGSAVNQDGRSNGITAPNKLAQEAVIRKALANAQLDPLRVSYVEAHGSGTALGDPIEIEALSTVLGRERSPEQPLLVGSVKTNVGHLAGAAGIAGLMKTVLALQHKEIPAHLHVKQLNPHVSWPEHAIAIPTIATPWPSAHETRVAGVSSFGWSGTNAHIILEEGPVVETSMMSRPLQLLLLSAKTETALEHATDNLVAYLQNHPETPLADIAHTLQTGRSRLEHRRLLVCRNREDALAALTDRNTIRLLTSRQTADRRPVAFLFPGLGEQYVGMASELYQTEPSFRQTVDFCCTFLKHSLGLNLDGALHQKNQRQETASPDEHEKAQGNGQQNGADAPVLHLPALLGRNGHSGNGHAAAFDRFKQTVYAQPLTFIIEYALAQLLMQWGIRPQAMLGYSLGEYVAACLSGVLALEDALVLVTRRAQLIQAQPAGAMLAVALPEQALSPYLSEQVSLAVINAPNTCVLSGSVEAMARVEQQLRQREIAYRRVETTHAFHSTLLDVLRHPLTDLARSVTLHEPQIPYISDVTGTWITAEQATDPTYWVQHMCQTVRFADGVGHLLQDTEYLLLEVGPGQSLGSFVRQHPACDRERMQDVFSTLPFEYERRPALAFLLTTLGKLWLAGAAIDWAGFYARERRRRVLLPTYPFERQRYWLEPKKRARAVPGSVALFPDDGLERKTAITDWFYLPLWKQAVVPPVPPIDALLAQKQCWVVFTDDCGIGSQVVDQLLKHGQDVLTVVPGSSFDERGERAYSLRPDVRADYAALFKALRERGQQCQQIVHLWTVTASIQPLSNSDQEEMLKRGFYSLLALAQALGDVGLERCAISVVSNEVHDVIGSESLCPEKATIAGPCRVIPQEYPNITCRSIDICLSEAYGQRGNAWLQRLMEELVTDSAETITALRGNRRWAQTFESLQLPEQDLQTAHLRAGGVYLITGGLGGIGLAIAAYLARTVSAKLVLVGRAGLPSRHEWKHILESQGEATGVGRQIRKMLDLEALGAKVLVMRADVSDEAQMRDVVRQASAMFGTIHGVFHAAGVPGAGLIQLKTPEQAARVLLPKVQGTLTLEHSLQGVPLDFLVLFSSITSTIGSPGQVDYCAANAFLDAFARSHSHDHGVTIAIDWSEWQWNAWEEGMAGYGEVGTSLKENRQRFGLSFEEGMEALKRALMSQKPQVVVSTQDFNNVVALSKSFTVTALLQEKRQDAVREATHLRPALGTSYVAPRNELERTIAALWEQLLGIEPVGINDNFFDLGGNSLLGTELIASMKKALHVADLPAYVLYEAPSVDAMARYLEQSKTAVPAEKTHERSERRRESLKQRMRETRRAR